MSDNANTPLSIDDAVEHLLGADEVNNEDTTDEVVNSEADPEELQIADNDAADDEPSEIDDEEVETTEEDGEDEESQPDPIDPPHFWDNEAKEKFAKLPREAQELLVAQDAKSQSHYGKLIETTTTAKKAAETNAKTLQDKATALEQLISNAEPLFVNRYANVDWQQAFAVDPVNAQIAKAEHDAEKNYLDQLVAQREETEAAALVEFHRSEAEAMTKMAESDPVVKRFLHPETGKEFKQAVAQYLVDNGVPADRLKYVSASEIALAAKAKLYDDLVAKQKEKKTTTPPAKKSVPQQSGKVRPSATPALSQSQQSASKLKNRLSQTGSIDDAVAYLLAKENNSKK
jgi:hypothetical protein